MTIEKLKIKLSILKKCLLGQEHYFPVQQKTKVEWAGNVGCGFYVVPALLSEKSIVYSFGIGQDVSFDENLMAKYKCHVYAYDPTPKAKLFVQERKMPSLFHFFGTALADYDGTAKFYLPANPDDVSCTTYNRWGYDEQKTAPITVPAKRLSTLMKENGHTQIDLLKMDIEGSEYAVIQDIVKSGVGIRQLCVEVHHRFQGIGVKKTVEMVRTLNEAGLYIAAISDTREEYTFVRRT